jgi:GMP synthase (glutamine-hydrolysing)
MKERPEVLILQHVSAEGPGRIRDTLESLGASCDIRRVDLGASVPRALGPFAGLVIMGGPMSVYESSRHPHLRDELVLVEEALRQRTPILGICLGSQLLAAALGARVYPSGRKELGWFDVHLTDAGRSDHAFVGSADPFRPLHWHRDIFDLPSGAVSLARSALTDHQAFRAADHALGLLFHLEVTLAQVADMAHAFAAELEESGIDGSALVEESAPCASNLEPIASRVFTQWATALRRP